MSFLPKVDALLARLNNIQPNSDRIARDIMSSRDFEYIMVELNREQLDKGQKSDGTLLPPYAPSTVKRKAKKGQQTAPMNLKDKGDFRQGMRVRTFAKKSEIFSTDDKNALLQNKYGRAIFGLLPGNLAFVRNWAREVFLQRTKQLFK